MRRLFSKNARLALTALPVAVGCALARQGDPPLPIIEGGGGEGTGGSTVTGGTSGSNPTGGTSGSSPTGGTAGSSPTGGTSGSSPTGGTAGSSPTGGTSGSSPTGGTAGQGGTAGTATGGTAGTATGGTAGSTGGSAGKGGTAGSTTGGTAGTATGGTAGGPPSGMELLRDNFEMGAGNWTPTPSGSWAIATDGSMVYASTGASATSTWRAAAAGQTSWTDVQIDARVKITSFEGMSTSYYAGICARYTSNSSYACFALRSQGQVSFRVNGSNEASWNPPAAITTGRWYTVRVIARGANITGFLDGTEIPAGSRVTGGAPASGRIALACPGTNAVFDDIVVTTP